MKIGKIIGRVVCTQKMECFDRWKLLLVQQLDENLKEVGDAFVATDLVQAGEGDIVYFEGGKEAGFAMDSLNPCDAAVIAIVDEIEGGSVK